MQSATGKFNPPPASLAPVSSKPFRSTAAFSSFAVVGFGSIATTEKPCPWKVHSLWLKNSWNPTWLASSRVQPPKFAPANDSETFWTLGSRENAIPGLSKPLKPPFPKEHTYIQKEPIAIVQKCRNEGAIHKFTMTTPPEDSVWRKSCKYTGCLTGILINGLL